MRIVDIEPMILALEKEKARDDCRGFWYSTVCSIIRLAESLPEIDATERKKGKWINADKEQFGYYKCSACGSYVKPFVTVRNRISNELQDGNGYDFCPYCTADMRGAE